MDLKQKSEHRKKDQSDKTLASVCVNKLTEKRYVVNTFNDFFGSI